jgi:hypothetical protein
MKHIVFALLVEITGQPEANFVSVWEAMSGMSIRIRKKASKADRMIHALTKAEKELREAMYLVDEARRRVRYH